LKDVFEPILNVVDPEKLGTLEDTRKLLAKFPSVFSSDSGAAM
jgi:hypothetical protein